MPRFLVGVLCFLTLISSSARGQNPSIAPIRVAAGTVLEFHVQTRLHPSGGDALDTLPKGTVLQVRMLDAVDSAVDPDGAEFHGSIMTPLVLGGEVVVHSDAEVRVLLVLLRSKSHPDGFRYELLVTRLTDHGKSYDLTASLNPSFLDPAAQPASGSKPETK